MADLYEMSDEDLEAAFLAAKESGDSAVDDVEDEVVDTPEDDNDDEDTTDDEDLDEGSDDDESENDDDSEEDEKDEPEDLTEDEDSDDNETEEDDEGETEEDSQEEQAKAVEAKSDETVQVTSHKFKANGMEYEFSDKEIMEQFPKIFGQAMDYTKKMQVMKPWRKTIDAIESAKWSHDDVNLAIDVLRGDKAAIQEVLKRTGTDTLDLDGIDEASYKPTDYGRDEQTLAIQDVIDDISADPEYSVTNHILAKEWDDSSWATMAKDPALIKLLHTDVKSGVYQSLQPIASKLKLYDRGAKSDLEYYKEAAVQKYQEEQLLVSREQVLAEERAQRETQAAEQARIAEVKAKQNKAKAVKTEAVARKAAAPVRKKIGSKKAVDYLDDTDEAFDEWYTKLQDRS